LVYVGPANAADTGTIRGQVIDGNTGEPRSGARVVLVGADEDGSDRERATASTGHDGRFSFRGLATGDDRFYVVDAFFQGGLFVGRPVQLPPDTTTPPVIEATLRVWETTTDPTVITITRDDLFLIPGDDGVSAIEAVAFENSSDRAYIGRGADTDAPSERAPSIGFALPGGAEQVQVLESDLDIPELVPAEFGFAATIAIPPGPTATTFSYRLPDPAAQRDLSRPILYPTEELSIHTRPPLTLETNRLTEDDERTIEGTTYRVWTSDESLDSGDRLEVVAIAEAGVPAALIIGVGAFALVLVTGGAFAWTRTRRTTSSRSRPRKGPDRDAVMTAIARLDLDYEAGRVERDAWERERARLKEQLTEREPAS
jgi:hypothetical protein